MNTFSWQHPFFFFFFLIRLTSTYLRLENKKLFLDKRYWYIQKISINSSIVVFLSLIIYTACCLGFGGFGRVFHVLSCSYFISRYLKSFSFPFWLPLSFYPLLTVIPTAKFTGNWLYFTSPTISTHCVNCMICIHRFLTNNTLFKYGNIANVYVFL